MVGKHLIGSLYLIVQLLSVAQSCAPPSLPPSNTTGPAAPFPTVVIGGNAYADLATTGFVLNHFCLNVNNLNASIEFYTKVFGMRLIFTFWATEKMSISYLAHSHGGKNGTAYQTVSELNQNKNNMEGLLELIYYDYDCTDEHPSTIELDNTFSHLGMVVPDIHAAQKRFEEFGVPVLRGAGETATEEFEKKLASAYGLGKAWDDNKEEVIDLLNVILASVPGINDFVFVTDPDGNLIEVQPQELPQIPI
jgi:lactoylglutathione lyase